MKKMMANKSSGFKFILASTALTVIVAIMYVFFGVASHTTVPAIVVCLIADIVLSVFLFFCETFVSDYIAIVKVALIGVAMATFMGNSIGDVTEFITGVGMYGNASNVYMRAVLVMLMLIDAIVQIIASKNKRVN